MKISFTIPGVPVPQARSRHRVVPLADGRAFVAQYDPKESRNWKALIKDYAANARRTWKADLFTEPLELEVVFVYPPLKSMKKAMRDDIERGGFFPKPTKPDLKNLIAAVEDAMIGILYRDDSLISSYGNSRKIYGRIAETWITLRTHPTI